MNHRQTTLWRFVATATVVSALVGSFAVRAYAAPNTEINYQGKLTDSDNTAVADGAYKVRFRVYTVASGGTALFDETHSLAVSSGLFSAMLGSAGSSTADVDWSQNALYLGVEVSNDGEMTPRKRISSVPSAHFSLDSAKLQGLVASDFIATSTFSVPSIGSVGSTSATTTFPGYIDVSRLKIGSLSGLLKQVGAVVTTATAGVDYITSAFQNWELTDGYLAPTTTLPILINNATSTITLFEATNATSTNATSTHTHISTLLTGALARITDAVFTNATSTNATSTNPYISGQLALASLAGPLQAISGVVSASSTLSVAYGGTGANTFATNGILYGNTKEALQVTAAGTGGNILMAGGSGVPGWVATTSIPLAGDVGGTLSATVIADNSIDGTDIALGSDATGDLMYYDSTNWARLGIGTAGYVLANVGGAPSWVATTTLATISGTLSLANGGTSKALTAAAGGAVYSDADSLEITAAGTAGQILMSGGSGAPSWVSTSTTLANYVPYPGASSALDLGAQTLTTTGLSTLTGGILVNNATSTITNLSMVTSTSTNATSTYTHISTLLTGALARITDAIFTNATTTNATSTNHYISGQLALASLAGPLQAISCVVSASSTLSVAYGGTGANTFASNGILYGNGGAAIGATAEGTNNYLLYSNNGTPAWTNSPTILGTNITSLSADNISAGTLAVARGGTGQTSFGQGWLHSDGTTFTASTSPTVNYIVATSTTQASTFMYRVGIGTSTPAGLMDMYGSNIRSLFTNTYIDNYDPFSLNVDNGGLGGFEISLLQGTKRQALFFGDATLDTNTIFGVAVSSDSGVTWNPALAVNHSGKVGMGTTTPLAKLDVAGANNATAPLFQLSKVASFATTTQFIVTNAGLVGVGTTSPWATLAVNPVAGAASNQFVVGSSTATSFLIDNSGKVGIGTTTPLALLHISKDQDAQTIGEIISNLNTGTNAYAELQLRNVETVNDAFRFGVTGTGFTTLGGFFQDAGFISAEANLPNGMSLITRNANAPILFYTGGHTNQRMIIGNTGLVGIGTTTPQWLTQIASSSASVTFRDRKNT